ncbi:hypothetical protein FQN53_008206 [Emmonsiellopsis sp. PD_33]|nr:hypothetical protein FQN53_008206 [Emmonsiellopsis sp. PD_33]
MVGFRGQVLLLLTALLSITASASFNFRGARGGFNAATGQRPERKDINKLSWSGPQWDLYIQALKAYQDEDHADLTSFQQVAGIHGYPYQSWDDVEGTRAAGYCSHGSTLFPLWHRPYLAMYEQKIWGHAQRIANEYPPALRGMYQRAAETLRIPYWDWASDPELPRSVITPELNINTSDGIRTVPNPLYNYTFNPTVEAGFPEGDPLLAFKTSVRNPDENGVPQIEDIQKTLNANGAYIRINTYQLLSGESNYTVFSTDALQDRGGSYNNLENIHGLIHNSIGGQRGHMTYTPWSSYDPIFWLHHTNVDRLVALWQAVHPDSFVIPVANMGGDMMKAAGTMEDAQTPFAPFHDFNGDFYTAETSRSTRFFGYTYPEIQDWGKSKEDLVSDVSREVNRLYNRRSDNNQKRDSMAIRSHLARHHKRVPDLSKKSLEDLKELNFKIKEFFEDLGKWSLLNFIKLGINNMKKQWVIQIKANKYALPHAFRIHFFLSEPPEESCEWPYASNLIGTFASFASSMGSPKNTTREMFGQIPLSHVLATVWHSGMIMDIDETAVVPLLQNHLEWRVVDMTGRVVDAGEMVGQEEGHSRGLEITIAERDVDPLDDLDDIRNTFPKLGEWKVYKDATKGKVGGCQDD